MTPWLERCLPLPVGGALNAEEWLFLRKTMRPPLVLIVMLFWVGLVSGLVSGVTVDPVAYVMVATFAGVACGVWSEERRTLLPLYQALPLRRRAVADILWFQRALLVPAAFVFGLLVVTFTRALMLGRPGLLLPAIATGLQLFLVFNGMVFALSGGIQLLGRRHKHADGTGPARSRVFAWAAGGLSWAAGLLPAILFSLQSFVVGETLDGQPAPELHGEMPWLGPLTWFGRLYGACLVLLVYHWRQETFLYVPSRAGIHRSEPVSKPVPAIYRPRRPVIRHPMLRFYLKPLAGGLVLVPLAAFLALSASDAFIESGRSDPGFFCSFMLPCVMPALSGRQKLPPLRTMRTLPLRRGALVLLFAAFSGVATVPVVPIVLVLPFVAFTDATVFMASHVLAACGILLCTLGIGVYIVGSRLVFYNPYTFGRMWSVFGVLVALVLYWVAVGVLYGRGEPWLANPGLYGLWLVGAVLAASGLWMLHRAVAHSSESYRRPGEPSIAFQAPVE